MAAFDTQPTHNFTICITITRWWLCPVNATQVTAVYKHTALLSTSVYIENTSSNPAKF